MTDEEKERKIAEYLVSEFFVGTPDSSWLQDMASTTPHPEMAHDLLLLVRNLDERVISNYKKGGI